MSVLGLVPAHWGRVLLCDTSSPPGQTRCLVLDGRRPDCDPRCSEHQQPDGYNDAARWADAMLEDHEQRQCPGCGLWTVWVPSVAADDLGRGCAS